MQNDFSIPVGISYVLHKYRLSQKEFAEQIGVTPQAVTNWMQQKNGMDESVKERIREMYDVTLTEPELEQKTLWVKPFGEYSFEELEVELPKIVGMVKVSAFEPLIREMLEDTIWIMIASEITEIEHYDWLELTGKVCEFACERNISESIEKESAKILTQIFEDIHSRSWDMRTRQIFLRANRCAQELNEIFPSRESEGSSLASVYRLSLHRLMISMEYIEDGQLKKIR